MVTEIVTKLSNRAFCPTYKNVFACKIPIFGSEIFIFMLLNQIATLVYWYICSLLACIAVLVYLQKDAFLPVLRAHRTGCIVCIRATGGGSDRWVGVSYETSGVAAARPPPHSDLTQSVQCSSAQWGEASKFSHLCCPVVAAAPRKASQGILHGKISQMGVGEIQRERESNSALEKSSKKDGGSCRC